MRQAKFSILSDRDVPREPVNPKQSSSKFAGKLREKKFLWFPPPPLPFLPLLTPCETIYRKLSITRNDRFQLIVYNWFNWLFYLRRNQWKIWKTFFGKQTLLLSDFDFVAHRGWRIKENQERIEKGRGWGIRRNWHELNAFRKNKEKKGRGGRTKKKKK